MGFGVTCVPAVLGHFGVDGQTGEACYYTSREWRFVFRIDWVVRSCRVGRRPS